MAVPAWLKNVFRPLDEDEEEYGGYVPPAPEAPVTPRATGQTAPYTPPPHTQTDRTGGNKVVAIHATAQLQVVLTKPEKFENAPEIAEHLRERRTVVLNLEQTNKEQARRLLDFLGGVAYAQDGMVRRVAVNTYLITPYNVALLGDLVDELENNGLYF